MTLRKVFRALQSEPFNCSVADIRRMTVPMIRNLLEVLRGEEERPSTPADALRALGGAPRPKP